MARDKRPEQLPSRDCASLSLSEFIEYASGGTIDPPYHLGEYFKLCESLGAPKRALTSAEAFKDVLHICVSMPPQHGKTTLIHYTIAWVLFLQPHCLFGYGSYGKQFSTAQTESIMRIYVHAGGELMKDHARKDDWRTSNGGGCLAFSPGSGIAGYQMHHIVFDDFVENEVDLDTEEKRRAIHADMNRATQRLWVGGSIITIGTRWHPEDPIGYMLGKGFTELNLPAIRIDEDGIEHALWPDKKPIAWLDQKRFPGPEFVGAYAWATQYQGQPIPPTGAVFGPPRYYEQLPEDAVPVVWGFDMATSAGKHSDWSCGVALFESKGLYYVHEVRRAKQVIGDVEQMLRSMSLDIPVPIASYVGGQERAIYDLLFYRGTEVQRMRAHVSKYARSQRASIAWKSGRIMVRANQAWTKAFVREVEFFTGAENGHDDQVDALVSGYDFHALNAPVGWAQEQGFRFGRAYGT